MSDEPNWEGAAENECGEHRTTGGRAWCFACQEWCYRSLPCRGCELPPLRAELAAERERADKAEAERDEYRRRAEQAEALLREVMSYAKPGYLAPKHVMASIDTHLAGGAS